MRRELKYVLPLGGGGSAVMRVRSRVPALTVQHGPRQVTSVYFDSANYDCYRLSNAGTSERLKLRLRWYGDIAVADRPVLELKHRTNHQGWKTQFPIAGVDLGRMTWAAIRREMSIQLPPAERIRLETLRFPILIATYRRHYFTTTDRRVRVTVDTGLRYFDQRNRPRPNLTFDSIRTGFAVVECKLDRSLADPEATRVLRPLGLRWTRFSKYCYGLGALSRS